MLCDGMGGIGWAGLPFVAALLDVQDIEMLAERLVTLRLHRPPEEQDSIHDD